MQPTQFPDFDYVFRTLAEWESNYDAESGLVRESLISPGYHTRIPDGARVSSTRTNLYYAVLLLQAGGGERAARAVGILRKILTLQDRDPISRTYGIWPWFVEESLTAMEAPDWNWADFCGAALGHVLVEHAGQVPADLREEIRAALGRAAWSIFRRNVQPDYTNIAIMGAGVCTLAGELLDEARLLEYGRRRLENFLAHTRFHGGFNEYNSPTYTLVALNELERILQLVSDGVVRDCAETLRQSAWGVIAEHFHPSTGQWSGPHSRAYFDYIDADGAAYLTAMTGQSIRKHPRGGDFHEIQFVRPLPCPAQLLGRFQALPQPEIELVNPFIRRKDGTTYVQGTTWLAEQICLGSVNLDSLWTQRRPLIAYWRTERDPAIVLRLRFLKDRRDFASAYLVNDQKRSRVLSAVGMAEDMGDFHLYLDSPKEGYFEAEAMSFRYELTGEGVGANQIGKAAFELAAGDFRAVIHALPGVFAGKPVHWASGVGANVAWVEATCYAGPRRNFSIRECGETALAAGLELLGPGELPAEKSPSIQIAGGRVRVLWGNDGSELAVDLPYSAAPPPVDTSVYRS
jgi:hypothetical protein